MERSQHKIHDLPVCLLPEHRSEQYPQSVPGLNILTQPVTGHQADPKTGLLIFSTKQGDRHNWRGANLHRFLSTDVEKAISRIHIMPWQPSPIPSEAISSSPTSVFSARLIIASDILLKFLSRSAKARIRLIPETLGTLVVTFYSCVLPSNYATVRKRVHQNHS